MSTLRGDSSGKALQPAGDPGRAACPPTCASSPLGHRNTGWVSDVRGRFQPQEMNQKHFLLRRPVLGPGHVPWDLEGSNWGRWNLAKTRLAQGHRRGLLGTELVSLGLGSCISVGRPRDPV